MIELNKIYQGDTLEVLKTFPDEFVDTIITSPPYWGLRDYGVKGQLGLEETLEKYLEKLLTVTQEFKRVLKKTGVLYWNHGDSYSSGSNTGTRFVEGGKTSILSREMLKNQGRCMTDQIQSKCLVMQNYRLILKMIDTQEWILRNTIIWHKPNHMPSSVKDRFANSYEPVFMLVKNKKYWFDLDAVRIPHEIDKDRPPGVVKARIFNYRVRDAEKKSKMCPQFKASEKEIEKYKQKHSKSTEKRDEGSGRNFGEYRWESPYEGKNPGDIWTIPTQPFSESHFATFPERLVIPMIESSCPKWICEKCGFIKERIVETEYIKDSNRFKNKKDNMSCPAGLGLDSSGHNSYNTKGWTSCKCEKGFKAGIVLDPFAGAGTSLMVAKKLMRNYIGIELNPEYIKIAEKRIYQECGDLF